MAKYNKGSTYRVLTLAGPKGVVETRALKARDSPGSCFLWTKQMLLQNKTMFGRCYCIYCDALQHKSRKLNQQLTCFLY